MSISSPDTEPKARRWLPMRASAVRRSDRGRCRLAGSAAQPAFLRHVHTLASGVQAGMQQSSSMLHLTPQQRCTMWSKLGLWQDGARGPANAWGHGEKTSTRRLAVDKATAPGNDWQDAPNVSSLGACQRARTCPCTRCLHMASVSHGAKCVKLARKPEQGETYL